MQRFEIKLTRIPTWILVVVVALAAIQAAVVGFVGATLLLLMSPLLLIAGAATQHNGGRQTVTPIRPSPNNGLRSRRSAPPIIDGEYQVIDDGAHNTDQKAS